MNFCLMGLAAAAASFSIASFSQDALAAAPPLKTQAPGFYRTTVGDFEVTTVLDGTIVLDAHSLLTNTQPGQVDALLAKQHQTSAVPTSVNTFLINTGTRLVLID